MKMIDLAIEVLEEMKQRDKQHALNRLLDFQRELDKEREEGVIRVATTQYGWNRYKNQHNAYKSIKPKVNWSI